MSSPLITFSDGSAAMGEKKTIDSDQNEHWEALKTALLRLLKVHVLDAIVFHITMLVSLSQSLA
jgi:hypothetical protein